MNHQPTQVKSTRKQSGPSPSGPLFFQPKLSINQPNDAYEQEADAMADKVMCNTAAVSATGFFQPAVVSHFIPLQRKCAHCEEEEKIQKKDAGGVTGAPATVEQAIHSGGQPLDLDTRAFMEGRFGYDFSGVKIHNDALAHQSAAAVNALAYTHERDIVFAAGQYQPENKKGKQLLAHELTHTLQQSSGHLIQRKKGDGHDLSSQRFSGNAVLEEVYDGTQTLQNGSAGKAVRLLQDSLVAQGYSLPKYGADGAMGNETTAAIRQFQADHGAVLIDGIIGPETMQLLDNADLQTLSSSTAAAPASTSAASTQTAVASANTITDPEGSSYIVLQPYGSNTPPIDSQGIADKGGVQKLSKLFDEKGVCWNGDFFGLELLFGTWPYSTDGSPARSIPPPLDVSMAFKETGGFTTYRYKAADASPIWYSAGMFTFNWQPAFQTFFTYPLNKKGSLKIHIEMMDIEVDRLLVYDDTIEYVRCNLVEACTDNAMPTNRWVIVPDNGGPIHPLGKSDPDDGEHYEIYKENGADNYFICMDDGKKVPLEKNGLPPFTEPSVTF